MFVNQFAPGPMKQKLQSHFFRVTRLHFDYIINDRFRQCRKVLYMMKPLVAC